MKLSLSLNSSKMNILTFCTILIFVSGHYFGVVNATPEHEDCSWSSSEHVGSMRDISDCRYFYHCIPGQLPFRQVCPQGEDFELYYNPNTTHCDYSNTVCEILPECCARVRDLSEDDSSTSTSNVPQLSEDELTAFEIDCGQEHCGLFPNTRGPADTYVVCVDGEKLIKNCHGGQLFDVTTNECQPANLARSWTEPNAGPHLYYRRRGGECPFHEYVPTTPIEERADSIILQNPVVTNWGEWQGWEECPTGMYATGLYAWRKHLWASWGIDDHIGIFSLSFRCQTPEGNETNTFIESLPPGHPPDVEWPMYYMCTGAVVGFQLNSVPERGHTGVRGNDEIATDNIVGFCSCSEPVFKPYDEPIYAPQDGHRGRWTESQYCRKHQAVCGMQTQMHRYREYIDTYDNNGLNNIRIKCCDVPNPLETCTPEEDRLHIRDCDNSDSDEGLRCDFDSMVGLTMDYENRQQVINFHSSVGYDFPQLREQMNERIITRLGEQVEAGATMEYTWGEVAPQVAEDEAISERSLFVEPRQRLELYQIVGRCDYLMVKSNRYARLVKDASGAVISESYFEV